MDWSVSNDYYYYYYYCRQSVYFVPLLALGRYLSVAGSVRLLVLFFCKSYSNKVFLLSSLLAAAATSFQCGDGPCDQSDLPKEKVTRVRTSALYLFLENKQSIKCLTFLHVRHLCMNELYNHPAWIKYFNFIMYHLIEKLRKIYFTRHDKKRTNFWAGYVP